MDRMMDNLTLRTILIYILCSFIITVCVVAKRRTTDALDEARLKSLRHVYKYIGRYVVPKNDKDIHKQYIANPRSQVPPSNFYRIWAFTELLSRGDVIYPSPTSNIYNAWRHTTLSTWDIGTNFMKFFTSPDLPAIPYYTATFSNQSVTASTNTIASLDVPSHLEQVHENWQNTYIVPTKKRYTNTLPWSIHYYRARDDNKSKNSRTLERDESSQIIDNSTDQTSEDRDVISDDKDKISQDRGQLSNLRNETSEDKYI